ncbi:MAG: aldo/keto reductase [Microbacteriaceae bacterium]
MTELPLSPGVSLPRFALGSWHTYDRMDFEDGVALLRAAVERGVTMFDVGVYGVPGARPPALTDVLWSAFIRGTGFGREKYLLSEKVWTDAYDGGFRAQLERALFRVGTDHADVVVLGDIHRDDLTMAMIGEAMQELVDAGLTRAWGVNNWSASNIHRLLDHAETEGTTPPAFAQLKYSVARRSIPDGAPFAALWERGFVFEASDVFEGGYLAGRARLDREVGRDPGDVRTTMLDYLPRWIETAESVGTTAAVLAMAFVLTHPHNVTTLFGATTLSQLQDNLAAADLVDSLGAERIRELARPFWADKDSVSPEGP